MSRARTIGISFVFGTGSKAAISRSRSVIRPALLPAGNLLEWLSKRLDGSQFYRTARIDGISILLGFNYGTYKTSRYVRRLYRRPGRAGRQLDLAFDIDGKAVASMTSERFREEFAWGLLDVLIDAGAGMKADVNELARLGAKFRAPFQSRLFAGVLGDYVDPPEPVDPFKYELELTVPLKGGWFGNLTELRAMQRLDELLDRALSCRDVGMLDGREMGNNEATFFLLGTDPRAMSKAVREDLMSGEGALQQPRGVKARVRRTGSDGPGKPVKL